jgi:hypothetical protein
MIGVLNLLRNVKFGIGVRQHNQNKIYNSFCTELCRMQKDKEKTSPKMCRTKLVGDRERAYLVSVPMSHHVLSLPWVMTRIV